ncbi:MAG: hypothetical protein ACR2N4_00370, partial [Jatrophihabitans sp.]
MSMVVCRKCSAHNPGGDAFCGGCGSFLEWTGEAVAAPAPAEQPDTPAEAPARERGWFERLTTAAGSLSVGRDLEQVPLIYEAPKPGGPAGAVRAPLPGAMPGAMP